MSLWARRNGWTTSHADGDGGDAERVTRRLTGQTLAREQIIPAMIERVKSLFGPPDTPKADQREPVGQAQRVDD